jgi:hypothetical protein
MRIHGLHVQGLKIPSGEHRIPFDSGYNAILTSDAQHSRALIELIRSLLFASPDLEELQSWAADEDSRAPRADLSVSFGADAYRLIADLARRRLVLGRYDSGSGQFQRVSMDPAEITQCLLDAGLPGPDQFAALNVYDPDFASEAAAQDPPEEVAEPPSEPAARREAGRNGGRLPQAQERVRTLRDARERFIRLERDAKNLEAELSRRSVLTDVVDDLDARVAQFRELLVQRAREIEAVEGQRRDLLDQRSRLRGVPAAQTSGMWLGVAIGVLGALVGHMVQPYFYALSVVGIGVALFGLGVARSARRRMGAVEARLAALRVRERSIERHFESESAPIRHLLQALELESTDELQREAADYRGALRRSSALADELDQARRDYPEEAETELRNLEQWTIDQLAQEEEEADDDTPVSTEPDLAAAASLSLAAPVSDELLRVDLDGLLREAVVASGQTERELQDRLGPVLPLYLRALSGGAYTQARYREIEGWAFRPEGAEGQLLFEELPAQDRARVALACRLALLEILAPAVRIPLLVGAGTVLLEPDEQVALARALRRLGGALQVLHFVTAEDPWTEFAGTAHQLSV